GDAAAGAEDGVLAVLALGGVGVTHVAAGPITVDAAAVIPAARVLADVAAKRAGIADLRAGHAPGGGGEQAEALAHDRIVFHIGERGQCTDRDAALVFAHALQLRDCRQVDDGLRAAHAVLQPVPAVLAAGDDPS